MINVSELKIGDFVFWKCKNSLICVKVGDICELDKKENRCMISGEGINITTGENAGFCCDYPIQFLENKRKVFHHLKQGALK